MKLGAEDLYTISGLEKINKQFIKIYNPDPRQIIQTSISVENFLVNLFGLEKQINAIGKKIKSLSVINKCKKLFIERIAQKTCKITKSWSEILKNAKSIFSVDTNCKYIEEELWAKTVLVWLENKENFALELDIAAQYALYMIGFDNKSSALFNVPRKLDFSNLITLQKKDIGPIEILEAPKFESRDGFGLTDHGFNLSQTTDHANYCIICHTRGKDSCRTGFFDKKSGEFKISKTSTQLKGCPLDQKISEVNYLYKIGHPIAALCAITLDNPMCAATGHRICNDCMRSCIYQNQDPVNVPAIETGILDTVLELEYGFEIYSLLTKWNPLRGQEAVPKKNSGYRVFISGLGPAGFTLSHYLLNEGHLVVAVDGAKIEPLSQNLSGADLNGAKTSFNLIKSTKDIFEDLQERQPWGFGGVAEYGITNRWNKNYLKVIRLILERRQNFFMFGGVRFGGNVNFDDVKKLGFDHIALCTGAGRPIIPNVKNLFCKGVRFASDFLMSLQLGCAFGRHSIFNLQIRMPIVVIGAGLTAVDAATEALAYYKVQVKKFYKRYKDLVERIGKDNLENSWSQEEMQITSEFLEHAEKITHASNSTEFLKSIGGVKILYRKKLQDCPAYRLNFEELKSAFAQGIEFIEDLTPIEVICDKFGSAESIKCIRYNKEFLISAKTVLIATGTVPNDVLKSEYPQEFKAKNFISEFGDLNKKYAGSVVSAMASAKDGYKKITEVISRNKQKFDDNFGKNIADLLTAKVLKVNVLSHHIFEILVRSPLAAKNFMPGQFYKLQNFVADKKDFAIEPIALTGAGVDKKNGILSLIALEVGASSYLCKFLKPGQKISLMGPTGSSTKIPKNKNVLLIGGGLGNAVLFSVAKAMKQNGCKIIYFAGYKKALDRFKAQEIEEHSDKVIWACQEFKLGTNRSHDHSIRGSIIDALDLYLIDKIANCPFSGIQVDHILTIGSDSMMNAVQGFVINNISCFKPALEAFASVNSPMQCMMKEICGQCIQKNTLHCQSKYIYSCNTQDQNLFQVDFKFLKKRLEQNSLWEKLNYTWVKQRCV